ncbi:hypothetical protein [Haloarchaeobius sp. DYHT-AS-18]|uniref:hypothetical protein n=1 Tax=Haloarchaeobius sp. DYHT-AS-18 TaxID=3446117 RepID=UPI003EB83AD2
MTVAMNGSRAVFEHYTGRAWSVATAERVTGATESRRRRVVAELHGVLERHGTAASGVGASLLCHVVYPGESATKGTALKRRLEAATALETLSANSDEFPTERLSVVLDVLDAAVHRPMGSAWRMTDRHDTHLSLVGSLCRVVDSCVADYPALVAPRVDVFVDILSLDAPVHSDGLRVLWSLADVEPEALGDALDALVAYLERGGWEFTAVALVLADVAETYPGHVSDNVSHLVRAMRQEYEPFSLVATQVTGNGYFEAITSPDRHPQKVFAEAMVAVADHEPIQLVDHLDPIVSFLADSSVVVKRYLERAVGTVATEAPSAFDREHVETLEGELDEFAPGTDLVMALAAILRADESATAVDPNVVEVLGSRLDPEREDWTFWSLLVLSEYVDSAPSVAATVADATAPLLRSAPEREQRVATTVLLRCANAAPESLRDHVPKVRYVACSAPEETGSLAVSVLQATLSGADADAAALTNRVLEAMTAISHDRPETLASCLPILAEYATTARPVVSSNAMHALAHTVAANPDAVSADTASAIRGVVEDGSRETQLWGCRALVSLVAARPSRVHVSPDTISRLCSSSGPFQQFSGAQLAYESDRLDLLEGVNSRMCASFHALLSSDDEAVRVQVERMLAVDEPFFDHETATELLQATPEVSRVASHLVEILAMSAPKHLGLSSGVDALEELVTDTLSSNSDADGGALSEEQLAAMRNAAYVLTTLSHRTEVTVSAEDAFAALRECDRLDLQGLGALGSLASSRAGTVRGQALCQQLAFLFECSAEGVHERGVAILEALRAGSDEASVVESELPGLTSELPAEERDLALRILVQLCRHLSASELRRVRSAVRSILLELSDAQGAHWTGVSGLSLQVLGLAIDPSMDAPPEDLTESMRTVLSSGTPEAKAELLQTIAVAARLVPNVVDAVEDAITDLDHPGCIAMATEVLAVVARTTGRVPVHPLWVNQFVYNEYPDIRHAAALVNARSHESDRRMDVSNLLENLVGGADDVVATIGLGRGAASARAVSSRVAERGETIEAALDGSPTEAHRAHVVRLLRSPHTVVRVHAYRVLKAVVEEASVSHVVDAIDALAAADPQSPPADGYVTTLVSFVNATDTLAGVAGLVAEDLVALDEATNGPENPAALVLTTLLDAYPAAAVDAIEVDSLEPSQFLKLLDVLRGMDPDPDCARTMVQTLIDRANRGGRDDEAGPGADDRGITAPGQSSLNVPETALVAVLESHLVAATTDDGDDVIETQSDWGGRVEARVDSLQEVLESPGQSRYVRSAAMEQWLPVPLLPAVQAVSTAAALAPDHAIRAVPAFVDLLDHHAGIIEFTSTGVLRSFTSHDASRTLDLAPDLTDALATRLVDSGVPQTASHAAHALANLVEATDDEDVGVTTVRAFATHLGSDRARVLPGVTHGFESLQQSTDADMTALVDPIVDRLLEPSPGATSERTRNALGGSRPNGPSDELVSAFRSVARQEPATVVDAVRLDGCQLPKMQTTSSMQYLMGALGALGAHSPSVLEDLDAHDRFVQAVDVDARIVVQEAAHAVHEVVRAHPSVAPSFVDYFSFVLESGSPLEHFEALATLFELVAQDAHHVFESLDALQPVVERQLVSEYAGSRYAAIRLLRDGYAQVGTLSATPDTVDRYLSVFEVGHSRTGTDGHSMVSIPDSADVPLQYALLGVRSYNWPEVDLDELLPDGTKYTDNPTLNRSHETMIHVHLYVLAAVADVFTTALDLSASSVDPHVDRVLALADDAIHQHRQLLGGRLIAAVAKNAPGALVGHEDAIHALLGRVPDSPLSGELRCTLVEAFTNLPASTAADTAWSRPAVATADEE